MLDYTTNDQSFGDEHHCPVHMMMTEFTLPTYLYLDPPVLDRTVGSKSSPSAPVCSRSPDAVPIDSSVHQVLFKCGPSRLRWTTSSSATTTRRPWHGVIGWSSRWHPTYYMSAI